MLSSVFKFFAPDLSETDIRKFSLFSIAFFFAIGSYWLLKTLKDGFFFHVVGGLYQPRVKILSLLVILVLVLIYSKLIDIFHRHQLFYIIGGTFASYFGLVSIVMAFSADYNTPFIKLVAWITYILIESFGSIIPVLFWSFVTSMTNADTAKKGYFLIVASAQLGSISGPFLAWHAKALGLPFLFAVATFSIIGLILVIKRFMRVIPRDQMIGGKQDIRSKEKSGFFEGLKLILTRPYLLGVFLIVSFYEIVTTIVDYQMKMQAHAMPEYSTTETLTSFMGIFGMATNALAFLMALFGTGYLIKRFGLRFCLLIFPIVLGFAISGLYGFISFGTTSSNAMLWITFAVVIIAKGLSYALNNPAKEVMYIPTSRDAKFKSKGWIDMFGARSSKAIGSGFNEFLKTSPIILLSYGTIISLGLIGIWIIIAFLVGKKFNNLIKNKEIIK